jgi:hypothetical protein
VTHGKTGTVRVLLVFADHGAFHREHVEIPVTSLERHERLVDCLREDPDVLAQVHVDPTRLCAAFIAEET